MTISPTKRVIIPYTPRPCQKEMEDAEAMYRFLVAVCHRRFGKTVRGAIRLIRSALASISHNPDYRGYYIAPNQKQAKRIVWHYFKRFLSGFDPGMIDFNETELRITFSFAKDSPMIYLAGSENIDSLRGVYIDDSVLDEMASWEKAEYAFYEVLYPAMSDRNGKSFIIGTVKGLDLFYEMHQLGQDKKKYPDWHTLIYPVDKTGVFTPQQIAELQRLMRPDAFAREYMCDFFAEAPDRLIAPADLANAVNRSVNENTVRSSPEIWGFDCGYSNDPSKLARRKGPLLRPIQTLENKDSTFQATWLKQQIDTYHPHSIYIDAGYGEGVIAKLNDLGYAHIVIPVWFGSASPSAGCFNMRAYMYWMYKKWLSGGSIPNDENLIKQSSNVLLDDKDPQRRIKLQPKDKIKEVIRCSPDDADATVLTFAGGGEETLSLQDALSVSGSVSTEREMLSILKAHNQNSYDPDTFIDSMLEGNLLDTISDKW